MKIHHLTCKSYGFLISLVILFVTNKTFSQSDIFLNLQSTSLEFPSLSYKDIKHSNQFLLLITNPNINDENRYLLKLNIQGNGISMQSGIAFETNNNHSFQSTLFSNQIAPFFDIDQLQLSGITKEEYLLAGLPEGLYTVCFTLVDATPGRSQAASNQSCINLYVRKNLPPEIINPFDQEEISNKGNYVFRWMPRHITGMPIMYHFSIFEEVENVSVHELLAYYKPVIIEKTYGLQYLYDNNSGRLIPGRKYVAFSYAESIHNNVLFVNGGFSEPIRFQVENNKEITFKPRPNRNSSSECLAASNVIINEFNFGKLADEGAYVELLAVGRRTSGNFIDLEGYILDDNNWPADLGGNSHTGHLRLNDCFNSIPKGSLILIYDPNYIPPGINIKEDGMPNTNGHYQISFSDACIGKIENCPDIPDYDYYCIPQYSKSGPWNQFAGFDQIGDVIQLRRPDSQIEHSLIWNTNLYELFASGQTVDLGTLNGFSLLDFSFTNGYNWYDYHNYTVDYNGQGTPGTPNSQENAALIESLVSFTDYEPFYITCSQIFVGPSPLAEVKITGTNSFSWFEVFVDGNVFIEYSTNNPIHIPDLQPGYHIIKVVDHSTGCSDECALEITDECINGTPCNDLNSCTENDILNEECVCAGQPSDIVEFTSFATYQQNCDYCISTVAQYWGMAYDLLWLHSFTLLLPNGEELVLSAANNIDDRGQIVLHFPYCFGCVGNDGIALLIADFNQWLDDNGYDGYISIGTSGPPCGDNSLIITNTNLTFLFGQASSNLGDNFVMPFNQSNCSPTQIPGGFNITSTLSDCQEEITWLWSTGETTESIHIPDLESCYTVWVQCGSGCTYIGTFPPEGDCDCIVGSPCIPEGTVDPCKFYEYNENCNCPGEEFPDSDSDGYCDQVDICPGFDDDHDDDGDNVPDGCDICHGYPDGDLTPEEIILALDGIEGNDPCSEYPCNQQVNFNITTLDEEFCNYCLQIDGSTTFPNDPMKYFKSVGIIENNEAQTINLLNDWEQFNNESFEIDWGIWNDGGNNANRINDPFFANNGVYAIELKSQNDGAFISSNVLAFADVCQVKLDFSFIAVGFDNVSQDLWVQLSTNNGSTFTNVKIYNYSQEFENNIRYNESVYINGPLTDNTIIRFRCDATGNNDKLYLDDIKITTISSAEPGCLSTNDDVNGLINYLGSWLIHNNYSGTIQHVVGFSDICGEGEFIQISNSSLAFQSLNIIGNGTSSSWIFDSPDCDDLLPGQEVFELQASVDCDAATYLWSTGETTSLITILNDEAGYTVTVTCPDGCIYNGEYGDQTCLVGSTCLIPGNLCNPEGITDPYCNCIVDVPNTTDLNGNGIPDCQENTCDCETLPILVYDDVTAQRCEICVDLNGVNNQLREGVVRFADNTTLTLSLFSNFSFPYCVGDGGPVPCDPDDIHNIDDFRRDLYKWALTQGYDINVLIQSDPAQNCGSSYALYIENAPFEHLELLVGSNVLPDNSECNDIIVGYSVSILLEDCAICSSNPIFQWSDGSTGNVPDVPIVSSTEIGYAVTVTCNFEYCTYIIQSAGPIDCIVGTPCDDGNLCTSEDEFNEHCLCAGTPGNATDSDGDGIPDDCDLCLGFDDNVDDDSDSVPNGCDECPGFNDNDPDVNPINCNPCSQTSVYKYKSEVDLKNYDPCPSGTDYITGFSILFPGSGTPVDFAFTNNQSYFKPSYCLSLFPCPPGSYVLEDLLVDLSYWLQAIIDDDQVLVNLMNGNLVIEHSFFQFKKIYVGCSPGLLSTYRNFTNQSETLHLLGTTCDDGNPCTIYDRWDEDCRCTGIYQDIDGDGVCDFDDDCPGYMDYIDFNANGIPDGCDPNFTISCNNQEISFCELFRKYLASVNGVPIATKESSLSTTTLNTPKVILRNLHTLQNELIDYFESVNWQPLNMNYPELILQLKNPSNPAYNSDQDGIVNFLDPCPYNDQMDGYISLAQMQAQDCRCQIKTSENLAILFGLLFEMVSFINDPNNLACFEPTSNYNISPGCAVELNIQVYEDENCVLRATEGNCPIEFKVDCNGNCLPPIYLGDLDGNHNCLEPENVGEICDPLLVECTGAGICAETVVVGNPDYDPEDPNSEPCICLILSQNDADGDEVCDPDDLCPGEDDLLDSDDDGIPDCIDNCKFIPGMKGDACNDNDDCTYGDHIDEICQCVGFEIDLDDDGVKDCEPCNAAVDTDGDGYMDEVTLENGIPQCDVCPGLDDLIDENGDDLPDCLFPPYYPLGCPFDFAIVEETGIVLIFDSEDITQSELPEPISAVLIFDIGGASSVKNYPYLTITNIRESNGNFEVLYLVDEIPTPIPDIISVGLTYSNHQQCILTYDFNNDSYTISDNSYISLPCPGLESKPSQNKFLLHFGIPDGYNIDPTNLISNIDFNLFSPDGFDLTDLYSISEATKILTGNDLTLSFSGIPNLGPDGTYTGTLMLPDELECTYGSGGTLVKDCVDVDLIPHAMGDPCDDNDPCTHHDQWQPINGVCICAGESNPIADSDGDEICDAIDPCPNEENTGPDSDGDDFPDCPCEDLVILSHELVNGNDVEIVLDMAQADKFSHIDVSIIGGPETIEIIGMKMSSPLVISNLPFGYYYFITLHGVCLTGGLSEASLEIELPFSEDQFVCGINISEVDLASFSMLPSLNNGDIFYAADFEIKVSYASGSHGKFKGNGYITVPYLAAARFNVSFKDIIISDDYQMVKGVIKIDGFGLAILGDEISDAINEIVNDILDPLNTLDDILEILIPLLNAIDDLIETTGHLVSTSTKQCLIDAQTNLESAQTQQPPATTVQLQALAAEVEACRLLYQAELNAILSTLSVVVEGLLDKIYNEQCTASQLTALQNTYDAISGLPLSEYIIDQEELDLDYNLSEELSNAGFNSNPENTETLEISISEIPDETALLMEDFYQDESAYHFCYLVDLMTNPASNELIDTPEEVTQILKVFIEVGTAISDEVAKSIKNGKTSAEIINDPDMQALFEQYLKSSVQIRSYGNIR